MDMHPELHISNCHHFVTLDLRKIEIVVISFIYSYFHEQIDQSSNNAYKVVIMAINVVAIYHKPKQDKCKGPAKNGIAMNYLWIAPFNLTSRVTSQSLFSVSSFPKLRIFSWQAEMRIENFISSLMTQGSTSVKKFVWNTPTND